MPLTIIGKDSRFEYDLNRDLSDCVYEDAWGKPVWRKTLPKAIIKESHQKHKIAAHSIYTHFSKQDIICDFR